MFQQPGDDGVKVEERTIHGIPVAAVEIKTEDGAESCRKVHNNSDWFA